MNYIVFDQEGEMLDILTFNLENDLLLFKAENPLLIVKEEEDDFVCNEDDFYEYDENDEALW